MPRDNQLFIDNGTRTYFCRPCDRYFSTEDGALNHCRTAQTHYGEWCERCEWLFVSEAARQTHFNNSSHHNFCNECDLDFSTYQELEDHDIDNHYLCAQCQEYFNDQGELDDHDVDTHGLCLECGEYFSNKNNLNQHKRTHHRADIRCLGCDREFAEFFAMMIHLEAGHCECRINRRDIDNWIFDDYRMAGEYTTSWNAYYRYRCPDCAGTFRFLSALCQHVATDACGQWDKQFFKDIRRCINRRI